MTPRSCVLVWVFLCAAAGHALAQKEPPNTGMVSRKGAIDIKKEAPKKKKIHYLIRSELKNTSYGNPCAKEVTHKMGFEYVITPLGQYGNRNGFQRNLNNLGPSLALTLKNGPLWKLRAKYKIKKCRKKSGDYMG